MEKAKKKPWLYRAIKATVGAFYPKTETVGLEALPDGPLVIVGNHAQLHGPIACELYFPDNYYIWCASQMMERKEVPAYAYGDFWSEKPKWQRPFFKLLSHIIAPLSVLIFNNARTVAVYKDRRIVKTFKESVERLANGQSIIIFPEHDEKHNNIVNGFQDGFVDLAKLYYKRTGKELSFVPLYIAPRLHKMYLGAPVAFSSEKPLEEEKKRICTYISDEISSIAYSLPEHVVVPYKNISKKLYPKNTKEARGE